MVTSMARPRNWLHANSRVILRLKQARHQFLYGACMVCHPISQNCIQHNYDTYKLMHVALICDTFKCVWSLWWHTLTQNLQSDINSRMWHVPIGQYISSSTCVHCFIIMCNRTDCKNTINMSRIDNIASDTDAS